MESPKKTPKSYKNGKIYTIRSYQTDKYYIGSTTQSLSKRLGKHKSNYKCYKAGKYHNVSSFEILKEGDAYIELLESFPCNNKGELEKHEGKLIRANKEECVNVRVPSGLNSKDYGKQYKLQNKDYVKQYIKQYMLQNKDKIKDVTSKLVTCDCGKVICHGNQAKHRKTKFHIAYFEAWQKIDIIPPNVRLI